VAVAALVLKGIRLQGTQSQLLHGLVLGRLCGVGFRNGGVHVAVAVLVLESVSLQGTRSTERL
jgi:uncharacterized membrane protein (DUF441 family)